MHVTHPLLTLSTTITSKLLQHTLFRGFFIALLGILMLVIGGIYFSPAFLKIWGGILFLISMLFISIGLLPYRRLTQLQLNPNQLLLTDSLNLTFYAKKKKIFTLPFKCIQRLAYIEQGKNYGIAIWLSSFEDSSIKIHYSSRLIQELKKLGIKHGNADLFLPYFTKRSYQELLDWEEFRHHFEEDHANE